MSTAEASPQRKGLQSPKAITCRRFTGFNYGDSPGDVEPSQDIIWDSTSPTAATTGLRNTRVVEISDIVNRIAPKERKQAAESPLLHWICDSVSCTPEVPKQRVRRKSIRQNSVEDLLKLARQFDENMQDGESSAGVHNSSGGDLRSTSKPKLRSADKMKDLQGSSSSDRVEAELQALFDCSTQRLSGRLSPASSASQEGKDPPVAARVEETKHSRLKSCETALQSNNDFDDDWENDDLLNDSLLLEVTHNPPQLVDKAKTSPHSSTKMETNQSYSGSQSTARSPLTCSVLQELCPKPKTTRSTFKLEPNPHFQAKDPSRPALAAVQAKPQIPQINSTKTPGQPDKTATCNTHTGAAAGSSQGVSDSLWDDGDDDTLLYQACDSVERISNAKSDQANFSHNKMHVLEQRGQKCTTPMPIHTVTSSVAKQESPRTFVRCNSLPATTSGAVNYRGWDVPMKGANSKAQMSQSLPGSHMALGTFNQSRNSSGKLQAGNDGATKATSAHTTFKRNFSDSAVTNNKVFVTSQAMGKCSAAEIERKKQEALARRRQRMQNGPKP